MIVFETHSAGGVDARPLHGDSDAVEEDDDQHNVVKHLVGDDLITQDPKPEREKVTLEMGLHIWYAAETSKCCNKCVFWYDDFSL